MASSTAEQAVAARRSGDALRCYDLATRGLAEQPHDRRLAYLACLALADLGNLEQAAELYQRHDAGDGADEDWLALRGRLYKEMALRGGAGSAGQYRASATAYAAAFHATGKPFSGVNAASMFLLAGDRDGSRRVARAVRDVLAAERPDDDAARYFFHVTDAELALVEGDAAAAGAALRRADAFLARDATGRSRTLRQLRQVCAVQAIDASVLASLALPAFACVLPGGGSGGEAAADHAGQLRCASLFVVPGQASEIEVAEAFHDAGVPLHLVLPADRADSLAQVTARLGADWARRVERLADAAQEVSTVSGFVAGEDERALDYARQVAVGLSRLRARQTGAQWHTLTTCGAGGSRVQLGATAAGTGSAAVWSFRAPATASRELQRRHAALIFADMTGFSRLPDADLPAYWNRLMPEVARSLSRYARHVLLQSTWGDALYIVMDDATAASRASLEILDTLLRVRREFSGGLGAMNVRLSIHYAPVYVGWDPVGLGKLYYGSHVSLAARIEPVTPPGSIYVTEALAAQLMLEGGMDGIELLYAGEIELAKRYGRRRMFHLRAAAVSATALMPETAPDGARELVLGCTGSLILPATQADWVRERLVQEVLPRVIDERQPAHVTLVMGLAPGADLLFAETARDWLYAQGVPCRIRTVLPTPPETLLADWNERLVRTGAADAEAVMRGQWATMCRVLDESASVVNLWPMDADVVDLATRSFRERQYRKLGAYLAQHSDVLVAICDPDAGGGVGGSAEVVGWRRDAEAIPQPLRSESLARERALVVVNPVRAKVEWSG
ncbi:MAG TPA: adenylate/guanylate cyclase domain-containing protein [Candidatus Binatia bacterium]|nr:adenylate/guanylate cyclase domain-containing protein [Candidatus Binatia bacterium]